MSDINNNKSIKQIPLINIAKKLAQANVKSICIVKYSFNTWKATFALKSLANNAISNKYLSNLGFVAFIPKYKAKYKSTSGD